MYALILVLHIVAALTTFVVMGRSLYVLAYYRTANYYAYTQAIAGLALFEIMTGTLLAFISPSTSFLKLTTHIAAYLIACAAVEFLLYDRIRAVWKY